MARIVETTHKEILSGYGQRRAGALSVTAMTGAAWLKGDRLNIAIGRMHWWGPLGEMIDGLALLNQTEKECVKLPGLLMWTKERGRIFKKRDIWLQANVPGGGEGTARCELDKFQETIARLASHNLPLK